MRGHHAQDHLLGTVEAFSSFDKVIDEPDKPYIHVLTLGSLLY